MYLSTSSKGVCDRAISVKAAPESALPYQPSLQVSCMKKRSVSYCSYQEGIIVMSQCMRLVLVPLLSNQSSDEPAQMGRLARALTAHILKV